MEIRGDLKMTTKKAYNSDLNLYIKMSKTTYEKLKSMKDTENHIFINGLVFNILKEYCGGKYTVQDALNASDIKEDTKRNNGNYSFYFSWAKPEDIKILEWTFRGKTNRQLRVPVLDGLVNLYAEERKWKN